MANFIQSVQNTRKQTKYPSNMIVNMDETPMYFDMASSKTVSRRGARTVSIRATGAEKRRLTVVLAASADGQMLPAMVIFKGKRALKNITVPR